MIALAGSLYLVSTFLFAGVAGVIGIRLVRLASRTGGRPERLLGLGLQLTGCWGYGVMIASMVARQRLDAIDHPAGVAITGLGWVAHNVGVMCMLGFVVQVFRPKDTWARGLAACMTVVLWVGWAIFVAQGGLVDLLPRGGYWIAFVTTGSYPLWIGSESFLYWSKMRRRQALGLAEPLLVDRFRMWGIASLSSAAAIWSTSIPVWLGETNNVGEAGPIAIVSMLITSAFGLFTVGTYWLTFFPPTWYRARIGAFPTTEG